MKHRNMVHAGACAALLLVLACAGGYQLISLGGLAYTKCWLSKPDSRIIVSACKQPLYETGNVNAYKASVKYCVGVFAVKIDNKGVLPLLTDSSHLKVLDGSGNPVGVVTNSDTASKLLGQSRLFGEDLASNPLFGNRLNPDNSYTALICVRTKGDPYFATYFLRFIGEDGALVTEARF